MLCEKDKFSCEHRSLQEFPIFTLHFAGFVSYFTFMILTRLARSASSSFISI